MNHFNPPPSYSEHPDLPVNPDRGPFLAALMVSFVGSLPPGVINVVTMQLSITGGYSTAFWFTAGSLLMETIYVGISLFMMERAIKIGVFMKMLQWISLIILVALAIASFAAASGDLASTRGLVGDSLPPFFFGFLLTALYPMQITFWFGWSTVLFARKILKRGAVNYALYIAGAGLGALLASLLFIFGGQFLITWLTVTQKTLHWVVGGVFLITAIVQAIKMRKGV